MTCRSAARTSSSEHKKYRRAKALRTTAEIVKSGDKWLISGYGQLVKIIKNCKRLIKAICSKPIMVTRTGIERFGTLFATCSKV